MIKYYNIAGLSISISYPDELSIPANMSLFEVEQSEVDHPHRYIMFFPDKCNPHALVLDCENRWKDAVCNKRDNLVVYTAGPLECRLLYFRGADYPYAICEEVSCEETQVTLLWEEPEMYVYDTIFSSVLSMERHLLQVRSLILHCAYVCSSGEAILFSAPSGVGKSTQAELWSKYRGTRQINGDASILNIRGGKWYANGFQVCGSSEICYNESYPIKAIVMLHQAKENTCRKLTPREAFPLLYAQIKINMWSMDFQNNMLDLIDALITEVPVYGLGCNISREAVDCLAEKIYNKY